MRLSFFFREDLGREGRSLRVGDRQGELRIGESFDMVWIDGSNEKSKRVCMYKSSREVRDLFVLAVRVKEEGS
jgi:hypothetical protein